MRREVSNRHNETACISQNLQVREESDYVEEDMKHDILLR